MITGGASGIGRGIVLGMAQEGADVAIPELNLEGTQQVADEAQAMGRNALAVKTDVTRRAKDVCLTSQARVTAYRSACVRQHLIVSVDMTSGVKS